MRAINKILVPTDYSTCAQAALLHALRLAQHYQSELHLLHVIEGGEDLHTEDSSTAGYNSPESAESWNDVRTHRVTLHDTDPTQAILDYAREQDISLIIMGAHGDSGANRFLICGLDYLLIGTTAEQIVRMATCPVLTVGLRRGRYPSLVKRILLPVDLTSPDASAIVYARELAAIYNAELNLLHISESTSNGKFKTTSTNWREIEIQSLTGLEAAYESTGGPDVKVEFHVRPGRPAREISAFAEANDIQLIVLSSHGMASTEHGPLQHENESIVQMASYSVFTTRATQVAGMCINNGAVLNGQLEPVSQTRVPLLRAHG